MRPSSRPVRVGIIANPLAGKDVRRLVARAATVSVAALVQNVRLLLCGLDAAGVDEAVIMPDPYQVGQSAADGAGAMRMRITLLPFVPTGTPRDTVNAASEMIRRGVGVIVTFGGDGTNRLVARVLIDGNSDDDECSATVLLPLAHGTNNVFPWRIDPAVAGWAAGIWAQHRLRNCLQRVKVWELWRNGKKVDIALVDIVRTRHLWRGSQAVWDSEVVAEVLLSWAHPAHVGLASLGGNLCPTRRKDPWGLQIRLDQSDGDNGPTNAVRVPVHLVPGQFEQLRVVEWRRIPVEGSVHLPSSGMLALDGERMYHLDGPTWIARLRAAGPYVLDPVQVLEERVKTCQEVRMAQWHER